MEFADRHMSKRWKCSQIIWKYGWGVKPESLLGPQFSPGQCGATEMGQRGNSISANRPTITTVQGVSCRFFDQPAESLLPRTGMGRQETEGREPIARQL